MCYFHSWWLIFQKPVQPSVQRIGGYAARFSGIFVALSFSRFDAESQPAHQRVTQAVETVEKVGK